MATATTTARPAFLSWDVSTIGPAISASVEFVGKVLLVTFSVIARVAFMSPSVTVGIVAFVAAHYLPLEAVAEPVQGYIAAYFPYLAGAGAFFAMLFISSKSALEVKNLVGSDES